MHITSIKISVGQIELCIILNWEMNCSKITMEELRPKTQHINLFMLILNCKFKELMKKREN